MSRSKRRKDPNLKQYIALAQGDSKLSASRTNQQVESVSVSWNRRAGRYVVQPEARHPTGASAAFGEPTLLRDSAPDQEITSTLLESLAKYSTQEFRDELAPKRSDAEQREVVKTHLNVCIVRSFEGDISLYPMRSRSGGYGATGEKIVVPANEVQANLAAALRQAFSKSQ